jgi:hypothetical protein
MPVSEKTRKALDVKSLPLPPGLGVTKLEVEEYTDSTGEPSLRVWVILDESTDVEKVSGQSIGEFKSAIQQRLREHGNTLFPYIFLAKESELADTDQE